MNRTKIPWVINQDGSRGWTWNPIIGCSHASEGCLHCYAETTAYQKTRHPNPKISGAYQGLTTVCGKWTGELRFVPGRMDQPGKVRKPSRIFVCSMSDLFHPLVMRGTHEDVFATMAGLPRHTFILLTKRPERMALAFGGRAVPSNVWIGVTAENQARYDERVPILMSIPARVRFVSVEPMLGPVTTGYKPYPDWVIAGPENGPGARRFDNAWIDGPVYFGLDHECKAKGIPFFDKRDHEGAVREMPPVVP